MLNVEWNTGIGYGDFVTGLGYAHTASVKYDTPVDLTFHWAHSKDFLFHPTDPETIIDRCDYIHSIFTPNPNVKINHKFNSEPRFRFYNQLDEMNPVHGLWHATLTPSKTKSVALWSSEHNVKFPGFNKDPAAHLWPLIKKKLRKAGYTINEITYRTPVRDAIQIINDCDFGIGYDGLAHQLFKFMWKPLIVFCQRTRLNKVLIPQATLEMEPIFFLDRGIELYIQDSLQKVSDTKIKHEQYIKEGGDATKSEFYNTFIY